jgi:hypothetical protein
MSEIFLIEREGRALPPFTLPLLLYYRKIFRLFYFQLLIFGQSPFFFSAKKSHKIFTGFSGSSIVFPART